MTPQAPPKPCPRPPPPPVPQNKNGRCRDGNEKTSLCGGPIQTSAQGGRGLLIGVARRMCLQGGFFSKCSCLEPIDWVSRGLGFWAEASSPGLNMRLHQLSQGLQWPMLSLPGPGDGETPPADQCCLALGPWIRLSPSRGHSYLALPQAGPGA